MMLHLVAPLLVVVLSPAPAAEAVGSDTGRTLTIAVVTEARPQLPADALRAALHEHGVTVVHDAEMQAGLALARAHAACATSDPACLAKLALILDVDAVVSFVTDGGACVALAADATPRVGRAGCGESDDAEGAARAVQAALAARAADASEATTASAAPPAASTTTLGAALAAAEAKTPLSEAASADRPSSSSSSSSPAALSLPNGDGAPWMVAGAVVSSAGLVSIAGSAVAVLLAGDSMEAAAAAPFQDDAVRFADEANTRLWIGGGAFGLGVLALGAGGMLLLAGAGP